MFRGRLTEHQKVLDQSRLTNSNKIVENQDDTLQKQIQCYTRKFEQEKRKLFRAQENHRQILKDYKNQVQDLKTLKSNKYQTEIGGLQAKIKYLEANLQKGIASYNQALSKNNILKSQIDELRKDKKNQKQGYRNLLQKIEELNSSINNMDQSITLKKSKVDKAKQQILQVRQKNEQQNNLHINNIQKLKQNQCYNSSLRENKNASHKQTTETSDTQPIVKLRIRNLMHLNKQKIKIADSYKKSMEKIWQSFQQIKQQSGIYDLEEITKTFLKQQQQNSIIFQYINKLTTELQMIKEENQNLATKIRNQEEIISQHRILMGGTPEEKRQKVKIDTFYKQKQKHIQNLNTFLSAIQPELLSVLNIQKKGGQNLLSYSNIQVYLASLQVLINQKFENQKTQAPCDVKYDGKQQFTKYSKAIPAITLDQLKEKNEQNMLEQNKLREYACEFWDKKKLNK